MEVAFSRRLHIAPPPPPVIDRLRGRASVVAGGGLRERWIIVKGMSFRMEGGMLLFGLSLDCLIASCGMKGLMPMLGDDCFLL